MTTMPAQRPGQSEQTVGTPPELLTAMERRGWDTAFDLAATEQNRVRQVPWFGPGSPHGEDSLAQDWHKLDGLLWCNPPFARIVNWVRKAAHEGDLGARVALLVPLSSGNWADEFVHGVAEVWALNPRLTFVGHKSPYPKDMMLCLYGHDRKIGFGIWRWKP